MINVGAYEEFPQRFESPREAVDFIASTRGFGAEVSVGEVEMYGRDAMIDLPDSCAEWFQGHDKLNYLFWVTSTRVDTHVDREYVLKAGEDGELHEEVVETLRDVEVEERTPWVVAFKKGEH